MVFSPPPAERPPRTAFPLGKGFENHAFQRLSGHPPIARTCSPKCCRHPAGSTLSRLLCPQLFQRLPCGVALRRFLGLTPAPGQFHAVVAYCTFKMAVMIRAAGGNE